GRRASPPTPWTSLLAGAAILLALALPLRHIHLGQTDVGKLPVSATARQAYDRIRQPPAYGRARLPPEHDRAGDRVPQHPDPAQGGALGRRRLRRPDVRVRPDRE